MEIRLRLTASEPIDTASTLAYVFLDQEFINAEMVEKGYAFVYRSFPFEYRNEFIRHEKEAKDRSLGLWGACKIICGAHACRTGEE